MIRQIGLEQKSAHRLAFEHYLRFGERLTEEWCAHRERKFNPHHDEGGRFTFAPAGMRMASVPNSDTFPTATSPSPQAAPGRRGATPAPPRTRIATVPGYPKSGETAWRSSNDAAFVAAADFYNRKYGLIPGDQGFRTPEFLKTWAMIESGGEGHEPAFRSDPFQVNVPADWPEDGSKQRIAGVRRGQRMTPAMSAYAALEWLRYKSQRFDAQGRVIGYRDDRQALERYNANGRRTRQSGSSPHYVWYADTILRMSRPLP